MLFPAKYLPVNWVDGMKISRQHFIDTNNHILDSLRDGISIHLNSLNFGLLPPFSGYNNSLEMEVLERASSSIEVRLTHCNAVTAGGCHVNITPDSYINSFNTAKSFDELNRLGGSEKNFFYIVLVVDPFNRIPAGVPDPQEAPPHHPYTGTRYLLQIVLADSINFATIGLHILVIGKIILQAGRYMADDLYIPPCTSIGSHTATRRYYETLGASVHNLQTTSTQLVEKIIARADKQNNYAKSIRFLCEKVLDFVAGIYFSFRNIVHQQLPVVFVGYFSSLANVLLTALNTLGKTEREALMQYIHTWDNKVKPGDLEELLRNTIEITYTHYDMKESFAQAENFINTINGLWKLLLSLDYVGKPKEGIIVTERVVTPQTTRRPGWTTLD